MSDNFQVKVAAEGRKALKLALSLVAQHHERATHWCVARHAIADNEHVVHLVLLWLDPDRDVPGHWSKPAAFITPLDLTSDTAAELVMEWLATATFPPQPDHDGDNEPGFTVSTGDLWGHIDDNHYTVCEIIPTWMMYGK
jgi:hypothetical protein